MGWIEALSDIFNNTQDSPEKVLVKSLIRDIELDIRNVEGKHNVNNKKEAKLRKKYDRNDDGDHKFLVACESESKKMVEHMDILKRKLTLAKARLEEIKSREAPVTKQVKEGR